MATDTGANGDAGNVGKETGAETGNEAKKESGQQTQQTLDEILANPVFKAEYEKRLNSHADTRVSQAILTHDEKLKAKAEEERLAKEAEEKKKEEEKTLSPEQKKISSLEEKLEKMTDMFGEFMGKTQIEKLDAAKESA